MSRMSTVGAVLKRPTYAIAATIISIVSMICLHNGQLAENISIV